MININNMLAPGLNPYLQGYGVHIKKMYLLLFSTFLYFLVLFSKKVKKNKKSCLLENVLAILIKKVKIMKKVKKVQKSTKKVVKKGISCEK